MANTAIRTKLGSLYAAPTGEPEYPGIQIFLARNGKSVMIAWVEVDQNYTPPELKVHAYDNCTEDEPTYDCCISAEHINEYFNSF